MNTESLITLVLVFVVGVAWILQRRRKATRVDASGVLFVRSLSRPVFLPWSEIECFGVASMCRIEEGLHQPGFTQYLGVRLEILSAKKESSACRDNRRLSDYDMLFTPDSGMTVVEFSKYLESAKAKFKKT